MFPSHQKPPIFASIFHQIFMFFPNHLPEVMFGGSRCQPMLKSAILDPFWIQGVPIMAPLDAILGQNGSKRLRPRMPEALPEPTWARFGAKNCPRTYFDRLLMNFGQVFDGFGMDFGRNSDIQCLFWLQYFDCLPLQISTLCRHSIRKMISASRRIFWHGFQALSKKKHFRDSVF